MKVVKIPKKLVNQNHQTTNFIFPNFFHEIFSAGPVEKFVFFFNCSNWEKFVEKIGEDKIRGLVVWCHEQDTLITLLSVPVLLNVLVWNYSKKIY